MSDGSVIVHSSGGAAGGVVSEGQGYGLFISAATAVAIGPSSSNFQSVVNTAYNIYLGWKKMCTLSTGSASCQTPFCGGGSYPCLPHWKFTDQLTVDQTGSAPDGDEDAILGMILLVSVTASNKPSWWTDVANWAYDSIRQFYTNDVLDTGSDAIVKLGSCWGGLDCNNPSYHAPGAYRAFRNYLSNYGPILGKSSSEISSYVANLNKLIASSYKILNADQNSYGLTTNWYVPNSGNIATTGTTGCSGSGTPSGEFGAEAARGVWRVAIDYLWFGTESTQSVTYLTKVVNELSSKYTGSSFGNLDTGGLVTSIFASWLQNSFIYGPTFCSLIMPVSTVSNQQNILNTAAGILNSGTISDYYAGSWTVISTLTISGDLEKAKSLVSGPPGTSSSNPPPTTTTPPPPNPPPTTTPPPTSSGSSTSLKCGLAGCVINNNYVEFVPPNGQVTTPQVKCADGRVISCTWSGTKYQCSSSTAVCASPVPLINGASCPLTRGTAVQSCSNNGVNINTYWVEYIPPITQYDATLATVYCADGRYIGCVADGTKVQCNPTTACSSPLPIYNGSPCPFPSSVLADGSAESITQMSPVIIGVAVGCTLLVVLIIIGVVVFLKKRQNLVETEVV
jgi:hypothetical protein